MEKKFDVYVPSIAVRVGENVVALKPHGIIKVMDLREIKGTIRYPERIINLKKCIKAIDKI